MRSIDVQLSKYLSALTGETRFEVLLAVALVSQRIASGDVCLDLKRCTETPFFQLPDTAGKLPKPLPFKVWSHMLLDSPLVGSPGTWRPLILDHHRLYLERYWQFENKLAVALESRFGTWNTEIDSTLLIAGLNRFFPPKNETSRPQQIDWQRIAAAVAVLRPFCVISGGPGTGKTHTVTAILALLIEQALAHVPRQTLRIALGVPTGKAAARLTQSIRERTVALKLDPEVTAIIPDEALTLHRLLGFRPGYCEPRYGTEFPLPLDVLVVDEASMLDLPMMARVLSALPQKARLILLGDRHQLASVEAGTVLGDLCGRGVQLSHSVTLSDKLQSYAQINIPVVVSDRKLSAIADHQVVLDKSHRFGPDSSIGALAKAVNNGDVKDALHILADHKYPDVTLISSGWSTLEDLLRERIVPVYHQVLNAETPKDALEAFNKIRVLCAVRGGPFGITAMNQLIEKLLAKAGILHLDKHRPMYLGRPLMVTANDYAQRLYNGDVGLVLPNLNKSATLLAFFDTQEGVRPVLPARVPPHESVYAMTVHKSQGSEFDEVILVLPEKEQRILTRELIYTGLTRAKKRVLLVAKPEIVTTAISRVITRASGLFDRLWN
ncbi:hypothetical protein TI03_00410 [Achromatium sp. WMS1]|nr:hypothetical protein TI03_00410 [Achromatium sp. WMS1]